jgi:hypothetical protein
VVYRWPDALGEGERAVIPAERLEQVLQVPYGRGDDHAEGICLLPGEGGGEEVLLVVYDSPAKGRLHDGAAIDADVFRLPQPRRKRRAAV